MKTVCIILGLLVVLLGWARDPLETRVNQLLRQSNYQAAQSLVREHLKREPDISSHYVLLSSVYQAEGRYSNAFRVMVRAYEYFPANPWVQKELADIYRRFSAYRRALALYRQGLSAVSDRQRVLWYYGMGVCYYHLGEYDRAVRFLRRAIEGRVSFWALYYLGKTYRRQNRQREALWAFERAELAVSYQKYWAARLLYYEWGTAWVELAVGIKSTNAASAKQVFERILRDERFSDRRVRERAEFWVRRL